MNAKKQDAAVVRMIERVGDGPDPELATSSPWSMIYVFARLFYAVRLRSEDALKPYNLTPMQFTILHTLSRLSGMSSAELSRRFNVTPQTMGEMVANLERRALLVRGQDENNRRALRLTLTEDGRRLVKQCDADMGQVEAGLLEGLTPRQREELRATLGALHDHMGLKQT